MGKKITIVGIFLLAILVISMRAQAATNPSVTFTTDEQLILSDPSLGNVFEGMAPGDVRTLTIEVKNENENTTDFYMGEEALQSLEDANEANGGAYSITLTVNDNEIYSNSNIGGTSSTGATVSRGLYDVEELKDKLFVATLKQGEVALVKFTMGLDGEAITNEESNSYANAVGEFNFQFQAAYDEDKGLTVVDREVVTVAPNKVVYVTGTVATGDTTNVWPLVLALVVGVLLVVGVVILLIKKKGSLALGLVLILCLIPASNIHATDTISENEISTLGSNAVATSARYYTVSFMSGASGKFDDGTNEHKFLVSADGLAKITDYMLDDVTPKDGYYVKGGNWNVSVGTPITMSSQYIISYGKLASDAVPYRIEYVDAASGDQIANSVIRYANPGDTILAPGVKFIENYEFSSASPATGIVLSGTEENVIQLAYQYTAGRTIENIVTRVVAGGITTITVNPVAPVAPVVPIPEPAVPQANEPAVTPPVTPDETIEDEETPEGETPADENNDDSEDQGTTIDDEETPEGAVPGQQDVDEKGNSTVILASVLAAIAIFLIAAYIIAAQKKRTNNLHHEDK